MENAIKASIVPDGLRRAWSQRNDPVIRPYIGQVIGRRLLLGGRVLRQGALPEVDDTTSKRQNLFNMNQIPLGPIYLRDWGAHLVLARKPPGTHKRLQIARILKFFPHLPVVLIGDSAEHDPEIFAGIAREFPGRIDSIYIRHVRKSRGRDPSMTNLVAELREVGTDFLLVSDSAAAAEHAARKGLIAAQAIDPVRRDARKDAG